jgi:glycosyltransferase involved in cell wall biosynthesis
MSAAVPVLSVLLCTRDHARALEATLCAFASVDLPAKDLPVEFIVIDNGSTDNTALVAARCAQDIFESRGIQYRYVYEARPGQCHARNSGLTAARGELILFTDDDVRPSHNWIVGMSRPLLDGAADAVVGRVTLAPYLERPWMLPIHRSWLAGTDMLKDGPLRLVGASMGFHKRVLEKVPRFDIELGPGALGFGDDTLFGQQLQVAGYRIASAFDTVIEHHPDADRLLRRSFLATAAKQGRSSAYVTHHWNHDKINWARVRAIKAAVRLAACRVAKGVAPVTRGDEEGISEREMLFAFYVSFFAHYAIEYRRTRRYEHHGLTVR